MADLQQAIVDHLRSGQQRSLVEIGVDLAIPYADLHSAVDQLVASGTLEILDAGDAHLYQLNAGALSTLRAPAGVS